MGRPRDAVDAAPQQDVVAGEAIKMRMPPLTCAPEVRGERRAGPRETPGGPESP